MFSKTKFVGVALATFVVSSFMDYGGDLPNCDSNGAKKAFEEHRNIVIDEM